MKKDEPLIRICGVNVDNINEEDVRKILKDNHNHEPVNDVAIQINEAIQSIKEILQSDTNSESAQSLYRRKQFELIASGLTIKQLKMRFFRIKNFFDFFEYLNKVASYMPDLF
jgi:hypothetical protein